MTTARPVLWTAALSAVLMLLLLLLLLPTVTAKFEYGEYKTVDQMRASREEPSDSPLMSLWSSALETATNSLYRLLRVSTVPRSDLSSLWDLFEYQQYPEYQQKYQQREYQQREYPSASTGQGRSYIGVFPAHHGAANCYRCPHPSSASGSEHIPRPEHKHNPVPAPEQYVPSAPPDQAASGSSVHPVRTAYHDYPQYDQYPEYTSYTDYGTGYTENGPYSEYGPYADYSPYNDYDPYGDYGDRVTTEEKEETQEPLVAPFIPGGTIWVGLQMVIPVTVTAAKRVSEDGGSRRARDVGEVGRTDGNGR